MTKTKKERIEKHKEQRAIAQAKAIRKIEHFDGRVLLADQMRIGKTYITLGYMTRNPKKVTPTIVICPEIGKLYWQDVAKRHFKIRGVVLDGTTPDTDDVLYDEKLYILNWDILQYWESFILSLKPKLVVFDECHHMKNPKAQTTKSAVEIGENTKRIIAIGGTPSKNGRAIELWPVLHMLRPDVFKSITKYRWRYCSPKHRPWGWTYDGAVNLDELNKRLNTFCMIRRLRSEVYDDETPKIRKIVTLPLSDPLEYYEAENNFIKWLSRRSVTKAKKAKKAQRLVQMGYLKRLAAKLKMPYTIKWIDKWLKKHPKKKIAVFAVHKEIIKPLAEYYKDKCAVVDGSIRGHKRKIAVETFQKNKKCRVFIGNTTACGTVISLSKASAMAGVEMDWTPGDMTQVEDRIYEQFSDKPMRIYYLVAKDTIEHYLCEVLQRKQEKQSAILDGNKKKNKLNVFDKLEKAILKGAKKR